MITGHLSCLGYIWCKCLPVCIWRLLSRVRLPHSWTDSAAGTCIDPGLKTKNHGRATQIPDQQIVQRKWEQQPIKACSGASPGLLCLSPASTTSVAYCHWVSTTSATQSMEGLPSTKSLPKLNYTDRPIEKQFIPNHLPQPPPLQISAQCSLDEQLLPSPSFSPPADKHVNKPHQNNIK